MQVAAANVIHQGPAQTGCRLPQDPAPADQTRSDTHPDARKPGSGSGHAHSQAVGQAGATARRDSPPGSLTPAGSTSVMHSLCTATWFPRGPMTWKPALPSCRHVESRSLKVTVKGCLTRLPESQASELKTLTGREFVWDAHYGRYADTPVTPDMPDGWNRTRTLGAFVLMMHSHTSPPHNSLTHALIASQPNRRKAASRERARVGCG